MKLFVGSLPFSLTSDELRELFAKLGNVVSAKIIMDRISGRSRGFGFVEMENEEDGNAAIEQLNGTDVGGRPIVVKVAHDSDGDRRGGGDRQPRKRYSHSE